MNQCAFCGLALSRHDLCPHHITVIDVDWATQNRIVCDLIHRGVVGDARNALRAAAKVRVARRAAP